MIPKNTAKIMRFLLRNTEKIGYNINQIAKSVKISVGSSFKILRDLEKTMRIVTFRGKKTSKRLFRKSC